MGSVCERENGECVCERERGVRERDKERVVEVKTSVVLFLVVLKLMSQGFWPWKMVSFLEDCSPAAVLPLLKDLNKHMLTITVFTEQEIDLSALRPALLVILCYINAYSLLGDFILS